MSVGEIITVVLLGTGAFFVLVAAVGILRFRDLLMRMHASSKASTLGTLCILAAVAVHFGDTAATARIALIGAFLLATAPVAAHAIARAAYRRGIELSPETHPDDLADSIETTPDRD